MVTEQGWKLTLDENHVEQVRDQILVSMDDARRLLGGVSDKLMYDLSNLGEVTSVRVGCPGTRNGRRMFVLASLHDYVDRLVAAQCGQQRAA